MKKLESVILWLQGFLPNWPSPVIELIMGLLLGAPGFVLSRLHHPIIAALLFAAAAALNEWYEMHADPWGDEPTDVIERYRGLVLAILLALVFA